MMLMMRHHGDDVLSPWCRCLSQLCCGLRSVAANF